MGGSAEYFLRIVYSQVLPVCLSNERDSLTANSGCSCFTFKVGGKEVVARRVPISVTSALRKNEGSATMSLHNLLNVVFAWLELTLHIL